jgi:hypothetical protein
MKKLRNEMADNGIPNLDKVCGFYIECLIWNVPDSILTSSESYYETIKNVIIYLYDELARKVNYLDWMEVSEMKPLFGSLQPWDKDDGIRFTKEAWNYIGYQNDKQQ